MSKINEGAYDVGQICLNGHIVNITRTDECRTLFAQDRTIIFKHSEACGCSRSAYQVIDKFCTARPDVTIYLVSVLDFRTVADFVEEQTGVRHHSPQVLALRNGTVYAHASHWSITSTFLETLAAPVSSPPK